MYVTYVLYSIKFQKTYIGFTSNLIARFHSHNSLAIKGYTLKYRPRIVILVEFFDVKKDAMIREKKLKSSRVKDFIRKLIEFISAS